MCCSRPGAAHVWAAGATAPTGSARATTAHRRSRSRPCRACRACAAPRRWQARARGGVERGSGLKDLRRDPWSSVRTPSQVAPVAFCLEIKQVRLSLPSRNREAIVCLVSITHLLYTPPSPQGAVPIVWVGDGSACTVLPAAGTTQYGACHAPHLNTPRATIPGRQRVSALSVEDRTVSQDHEAAGVKATKPRSLYPLRSGHPQLMWRGAKGTPRRGMPRHLSTARSCDGLALEAAGVRLSR